jgi:hypothetical protein
MKAVAVFGVVLVTMIIACTKSTGIDGQERSMLLINKKWQLTMLITKTESGATTINGVDSLPDFRKDDYLLMKADSTYEYNDHILLRPGGSSQILDAGNWMLISGNHALELHSTVYAHTYPPFQILELNATTMKLETRSASDNSIVQLTFKPQ